MRKGGAGGLSDLPTGVAAWVQLYGSGSFSRAHLRSRLEEVEAIRNNRWHKDFEDRADIIEALRYLLTRPCKQLTLFD